MDAPEAKKMKMEAKNGEREEEMTTSDSAQGGLEVNSVEKKKVKAAKKKDAIEEIIVTDASVPARVPKTKKLGVFPNDEQISCDFNLQSEYYECNGKHLYTVSQEIDGVPFTVTFCMPKLDDAERDQAEEAGTDYLTADISLFRDRPELKCGWSDLRVKWSYDFFAAPHIPADADDDFDETQTFEVVGGPIESSHRDGFGKSINIGSYCFLSDPDNGYTRERPDFHCPNFHLTLTITVHSTSFSLSKLRTVLDRPNENSDVCFRVHGQALYANKTLLSLHSDVFRTMFTSEFREKNAKVIPITDGEVGYREFDEFLRSIYPEGVEVTSSNISSLLHLGHLYDVQRTLKDCYEYLIRNTDDALYLRCDLAVKYNYIQVWENAIAEMLKNGIKGEYSRLAYRMSGSVKAKILDAVTAAAREKEWEEERRKK